MKRSLLLAAAIGLVTAGPTASFAQQGATSGADLPPLVKGAKMALNNEFVTMWDVTWPNEPWSHTPAKDEVIIFLQDGPVKIKGTGDMGEHVKVGQVVYLKAGQSRDMGQSTAASAQEARHAIITELKDLPASLTQSKAPLKKYPVPTVFPREGSTKVFENDRVVAWDLTWAEQPWMHVHYRANIFVHLVDGPIVVTNYDGTKNVSEHTQVGRLGFQNAGTGPHMEQNTAGPGQQRRRALFVELKGTEVRDTAQGSR